MGTKLIAKDRPFLEVNQFFVFREVPRLSFQDSNLSSESDLIYGMELRELLALTSYPYSDGAESV